MNLGFIEYLHKSIKHIDATLGGDIAKGMDIFGDIPETGALREKTTIPQVGINDLQENVKNANDKIIKDLKTQNNGNIHKVVAVNVWRCKMRVA